MSNTQICDQKEVLTDSWLWKYKSYSLKTLDFLDMWSSPPISFWHGGTNHNKEQDKNCEKQLM